MKSLFGLLEAQSFHSVDENGLPLDLVSIAAIFRDAFNEVQPFNGPYAALRGHFKSRIISELIGNFSSLYSDEVLQQIDAFIRTCTEDVEYNTMSSLLSATKNFLKAIWARDAAVDLQENAATIVSTARILLTSLTAHVPYEDFYYLFEAVRVRAGETRLRVGPDYHL